MKNEKEGLDMTVYRVRKDFLYMADDNGKKYRVKNNLGSLAEVGMRLRNVVFAPKKEAAN